MFDGDRISRTLIVMRDNHRLTATGAIQRSPSMRRTHLQMLSAFEAGESNFFSLQFRAVTEMLSGPHRLGDLADVLDEFVRFERLRHVAIGTDATGKVPRIVHVDLAQHHHGNTIVVPLHLLADLEAGHIVWKHQFHNDKVGKMH